MLDDATGEEASRAQGRQHSHLGCDHSRALARSQALAYVQGTWREPYFRPGVDAATALQYSTLTDRLEQAGDLIEHLAALMEAARRSGHWRACTLSDPD